MSDNQTVFDALLAALDSVRQYNSNDQAAPAAILWPDKGQEWTELLPRLREALPQLLTFGDYDPGTKTGPAIWLRCMIARTLPEADWSEDATPIIYLPGFSRQELRAVEECPKPLLPLAELQFRGVLFSQVSARDWTAMAFLVSEEGGGLGLDVARDRATEEAMMRALPALAGEHVAALRGRKLQAAYFDDLVNPDETRSVLMWLSDPSAVRTAWPANQWDAFRARCTSKFGFDPDTDGTLIAAELLGARSGDWATVWDRYAEAPATYPGIPDLLRQARPSATDDLFFDLSTWPQDNQEMEDTVRKRLAELGEASPADARTEIRQLEAKHGDRREWVWATLGQAPLAQALEALAVLADVTETALGGTTPREVAENYVSDLWRADAAALDALACVEHPDDVAAVSEALRATYAPWLTAAAEHFQQTVDTHGYPDDNETGEREDSTCVLFADGLRFDVAQKLGAALESEGIEATVDWSFAAMPTVTPTAKPAVSPVAGLLAGGDTGEDFLPSTKADSRKLTADVLRQCLAQEGIDVLANSDTGSTIGIAWTEYGSLDKRGHDEGTKLARMIDEEVRGLVIRVRQLLDAGWRKVQIVTDHGWLLLPGGLPKVELPHYLAQTRWGRCAVLKPTANTDMLTVPWRWNQDARIAPAPGIGCFIAGREFAHGGLSVQECVVPVATVSGAERGPEVSIEEVKWVGLRCRLQIDGGAGFLADLRTKVSDPESSVVQKGEPIAVADDGLASLLVTDYDLEGTAVNVVILGAAGDAIARRATTVGGESDEDGT